MNEGMENLKEIQDLEERSINPLIRIADALEEILRLVKQDQEKFERYREETTEKWDEPKNDPPDNINGRPYKGRL